MKRLALLLLALLLIVASISAQMPARVTSRPIIPTTEALDRLNLKLGWRAYLPIDGKKDGILSVQLLGQEMYVQFRSGPVLALNAETGQRLWYVSHAAPYRAIFPLGHNYNTIFQIAGTRVYALDRASGQLAWVWDLAGAPSSGPVADAEQLYVCTSGNRLRVYDLTQFGPREGAAPGTDTYTKTKKKDDEDRKEKAKESVPVTRAGQATQSNIGARGMTSAANQSSYVGVGNEEGSNDWTLPLMWTYRGAGRIDHPPLLSLRNPDHPGYILMAGSDGSITVSSKIESRIASTSDAGSAIAAPMNQYGDTAYVPMENGTLVAMSIETGRPLWRVGMAGAINERPAVTEEDVYAVSARGGLHRIDRVKGDMLWRHAKADRFLAANKNLVYALDKIGNLLVIDRVRGTLVNSLDTHEFTVPIQNEYTDRVYLAANDGLIFCVRDRENVKPLVNRKFEEDKTVLKKSPEERAREALQKEGMKKEEKKEMEKKEDKKE